MKYKILVTNDDSINFSGLKTLATAFLPFASEMIVVAPHVEMSATSRKLSVKNSFRLYYHDDLIEGVKTYSLEGTPTDCVKFARIALGFDFDIVVSGINKGYNLSDDIMYSGTCAAALEAEFVGKHGFAYSTVPNNCDNQEIIDKIAKYSIDNLLTDDCLVYNINYSDNLKEEKYIYTHQGKRQVKGYYEFLSKASNVYFLDNHHYGDEIVYEERENDELSDFIVTLNGYISVTPLDNDLTHNKMIAKNLKK